MCVHAGVAMGTGVGASRRGSGLGRVGAGQCVGVGLGVFECVLVFFASGFFFSKN